MNFKWKPLESNKSHQSISKHIYSFVFTLSQLKLWRLKQERFKGIDAIRTAIRCMCERRIEPDEEKKMVRNETREQSSVYKRLRIHQRKESMKIVNLPLDERKCIKYLLLANIASVILSGLQCEEFILLVKSTCRCILMHSHTPYLSIHPCWRLSPGPGVATSPTSKHSVGDSTGYNLFQRIYPLTNIFKLIIGLWAWGTLTGLACKCSRTWLAAIPCEDIPIY